MNTKICSICHKEKPIDEFYKKLDGWSHRCIKCEKDYQSRYYKKNRKKRIAVAHKHNLEQRVRVEQFVVEYLLKHPCVDCDEKDIIVLQFDHKDGVEKDADVARMISQNRPVSLTTLREEIAKCEVRCANCHQRKTAIKTKYWKLKYLGD